MRILITGGSGVLGRATTPLLVAQGHDVVAPDHADLDAFDAQQVAAAVRGAGALMHLATRVPPVERWDEPGAWDENVRLRAKAPTVLIDAALATGARVYVQPTVTCDDPHGEGPAEAEVARFAAGGGRGVVLRLGYLDGPTTGIDAPDSRVLGATLHIEDAARALVAALSVPSGVYDVCRDGDRYSRARFTQTCGWEPLR
jgi:nucleoside-diphosphate-sugar epimerase